MSEINYDRYNEIIQHLLDGMWRDPDDLEIGRDISDIPEVKIIFDGYGYDEENDIEGGNKNMESYAIFIHKDTAQPDFIFPEHDLTPWALIHRPKEEVCIYAWYDVVNDDWSINSLDETSEHSMTDEEVMVILETLYENYFKPWENTDFSIDPVTGLPNWPFGNNK